jgi:protoheme IX farnesyltransferase
MALIEHDEPGFSADQWIGGIGSPSDYFALLKPRVMSLVVFTALVGMVLAPGHINPVLGAVALFCIAVGAGAAGALNMWYDADIDAIMRRTAGRPVPSGRIQPAEAASFGLVLAVFSVMILGLAVNWQAGAFLAFTIFFYAVVYTMWLKRWTPQNIVIGGAAGAFPPMIGWVAVTGSVSLESVILFLLIFVWTPPHFWALALVKSDDYARAGVPMMPVTAGAASTRRQIFLYALVLAPLGLAPWFAGFGGPVYLATAVVLGATFVWKSWRVLTVSKGPAANRTAMDLFVFSIAYLFLLYAVLLAERLGALVLG